MRKGGRQAAGGGEAGKRQKKQELAEAASRSINCK